MLSIANEAVKILQQRQQEFFQFIATDWSLELCVMIRSTEQQVDKIASFATYAHCTAPKNKPVFSLSAFPIL